MTGRLQGKRAMVTGAAAGIGAATAAAFLAEGARVVFADRSPVHVPDGSDAFGVELDVSDEMSWQAAAATVQERLGGLDVLVNVAGIVSWDGVAETTLDEWDRVIAVNQTGTWLGMKTCMPMLLGGGGAVVNTSSVLGIVGGGGAAAYHATKGAVRLLTKTAAVQYASQGVRVNSIHPGVIATPMIQDILDEEGDQQPDILRTPMRRAGTAQEIAAGMVFLASDESSFMTGAELVIDGGMTAH